MQMETHLVECKIDQSFDYLITAGGHSRREQQTHQQGTVSVRQANPNRVPILKSQDLAKG